MALLQLESPEAHSLSSGQKVKSSMLIEQGI